MSVNPNYLKYVSTHWAYFFADFLMLLSVCFRKSHQDISPLGITFLYVITLFDSIIEQT